MTKTQGEGHPRPAFGYPIKEFFNSFVRLNKENLCISQYDVKGSTLAILQKDPSGIDTSNFIDKTYGVF